MAAIEEALGDADTVLNVGAGAGSYEPQSRRVIAIEPSEVMAAQRPAHRVPAILATSDRLPMIDGAVDAAMTVLSLHHWDEHRERGIAEMRRVARGPVVVVTYDAAVSSTMWLMADYLPEVAELDQRTFPPIDEVAPRRLGDGAAAPAPPRHTGLDARLVLGSSGAGARCERPAGDERLRANGLGGRRARGGGRTRRPERRSMGRQLRSPA